jgi:hypothetical protein
MDFEQCGMEITSEEYQRLSVLAKTGELDNEASIVVDDLADCIERLSRPAIDKLDLYWELFRDIPCYSVLSHVHSLYQELSDVERSLLWRVFRRYLAQEDDVYAKHVEYTLWCDYFEQREHVEAMWNAMITARNDRQLQRVLGCSGPVPYELKRALYLKLIDSPKWHFFIYQSLLYSFHDYFGDIDKEDAHILLAKLSLPSDTEHLEELKRDLGC